MRRMVCNCLLLLRSLLGAGAGFALEDVFVLTRAVSWAHDHNLPLGEGLRLFDEVRSPHYGRLVRLNLHQMFSITCAHVSV